MAEYWVGPSLRTPRTSPWKEPTQHTQEGLPQAVRRRARPLTPRRWRAAARLAASKRHDIEFLTRYTAHMAVLVLSLAAAYLHGAKLKDYLPTPAPRAVEAVAPIEWAASSNEMEAGYLYWGAVPHSVIPERPAAARTEAITYQVRTGDNPTIIAERFGLEPATIVWANEEGVANPDLLSIGQELIIPPTDGVLHLVKEGETAAALASKYSVAPEAITGYSSNHVTDANAALMVGARVMVPGGIRPYIPPTPVPTPAPARVNTTTTAPRTTTTTTAPRTTTTSTTRTTTTTTPPRTTTGVATGRMNWPLVGRITQQPSSWHMALDIAIPIGTAVRATDGGRVVYSGWDSTGYGWLVIVDHGNGLRTVYAHNSRLWVSYGDYVSKGQTISLSGSSGNSTGPHLHFEVRINGYGRVNPYRYLP